MPRKQRAEVPGGYFHLTTRGVNRETIYLAERDRAAFLVLLGRTARRYGWICIAYCLMGNHYHLVVKTPEPTLARGMQFLNGEYARYVNERYGRTGHLFGRRYWSVMIETHEQLLEVSRYVVLNPVRAGLCADPVAWRWSSFAATVGVLRPPAFLRIDEQLGLFSPNRRAARVAYREFVALGIEPPA